jgi:hypothetical protein
MGICVICYEPTLLRRSDLEKGMCKLPIPPALKEKDRKRKKNF